MRLGRQFAAVIILMLCACLAVGQAQTADWLGARYTAADDPTNQGWTVYVHNPHTSVWANAFFDATHNANAWLTHVDAGLNWAGIRYDGALSHSVVSLGQTHGWRLQARMRAPGTPEGPLVGIEMDERSYYISFYTTDLDHAYLLAVTNVSDTSPGPPFVGIGIDTAATYADYHTYGMAYDPVLDAVSVTVDDTVVLSNHPGAPWGPLAEERVLWGSGGEYISDEAYWLSIDFSVSVPRPVITQVRSADPHGVEVECYAHSNLLYRAHHTASLAAPEWRAESGTVTGRNSSVTIPVGTGATNCTFVSVLAWPQE